jgi:aryl-alcohol dehydrogenase-like predicted oxidoreductase
MVSRAICAEHWSITASAMLLPMTGWSKRGRRCIRVAVWNLSINAKSAANSYSTLQSRLSQVGTTRTCKAASVGVVRYVPLAQARLALNRIDSKTRPWLRYRREAVSLALRAFMLSGV